MYEAYLFGCPQIAVHSSVSDPYSLIPDPDSRVLMTKIFCPPVSGSTDLIESVSETLVHSCGVVFLRCYTIRKTFFLFLNDALLSIQPQKFLSFSDIRFLVFVSLILILVTGYRTYCAIIILYLVPVSYLLHILRYCS